MRAIADDDHRPPVIDVTGRTQSAFGRISRRESDSLARWLGAREPVRPHTREQNGAILDRSS
jgi:hypothetical protein